MSRQTFLPYTCPTCRRQSWHPQDLAERFCSSCGFEGDHLPEIHLTPNHQETPSDVGHAAD